MKRAYFLFLSVFSLVALGQAYRPLDSTLVWSTKRYYKQGGQFCLIETYSRYNMKGYALNNGRIWNKLYESGYSSASMYCTFVPAPFKDALAGYVHSDPLNRKVYFVTSLVPNYNPAQSDLLYDFNKSIGDTLFIHNSSDFKITSIDSLLFSNKYHKRYHTSPIGASPLPGDVTFVEGIGSSIGPFVHSTFFESGSSLLCFASPSQTMTITNYSIYKDGYCEGVTISVDETGSYPFQRIYPNPFHNTLIVDLPATDVRIFDALGRLTLERKTAGGKTTLDAEFLAPGIYFLNAGGVTRKIIKE